MGITQQKHCICEETDADENSSERIEGERRNDNCDEKQSEDALYERR